MFTLYRPAYYDNPRASSFVGLSTDEKPLDEKNGASFEEIDTGKVFRFDEENKVWHEEVKRGGGTSVYPYNNNPEALGHEANPGTSDNYSRGDHIHPLPSVSDLGALPALNIANEFSTSSTYAVGDYVIYEGQLYQCTTAVTTAGSWNSSNWVQAVLGNDVSELKSTIANEIERYTTPTENLWKPLWELGTLNTTDGTPESSTTIIRIADFIDVEPDTTYAFYDARDWTKEQYNMLYPAQFIYEYEADGTFIKSTTNYYQQFKTSDSTYKVKFRTNKLPIGFNLTTYNTKKFLLYKGSTYRDYVPPYPALNTPSFPVTGHTSDNLFHGGMFGYINSNNASVNVNATSACTSTNWIKVKKTEHPTIYRYIFGYSGTYNVGIAFCYDADKMFIGKVTGTTVSTTVFGNVASIDLLDNTEYVILRSSEYGGTEENFAKIAELKAACEDGLYVSTSLDAIYYNHQINGKNKITADDTNNDFLCKIRNNNIRGFMLDGLKSYVDGLLATGYDALIPAMTDIHAYSYEPWAVINYMADSGAADVVVNLGDNIVDHFDTKAKAVSFLRDRFGIQFKYAVKAPMLSAVGNHDTNPVNGSNISDGSKMLHPDELYSLMRMRNSSGMLSGKCYGYYDLVNAKIRVVILNTSDIYDTDGTPLCSGNNTAVSQAQFDWFCDVALDFSEKDDADEWAVITMSHDRLSVVGGTGDPFATVITAFTTGTSGTATGSRTLNGHTFTLSKEVDYSSQGAIEYIGHIHGHYHEDKMTVFATNYKEVGIPCAVMTAYYYDEGTRKDYTRTKGTTEELLFDTVCIDRANHSVLMKRFGGVGADRTFTYGA